MTGPDDPRRFEDSTSASDSFEIGRAPLAHDDPAGDRTTAPLAQTADLVREPERTSSRDAVSHSLPAAFGRYRILGPLGSGGMASVFLAVDTSLDRRVAIKTPHFDGVDDEMTRKRFEREALAASSLSHEHICPVLDVGEVDGRPFLAMAYVEGESLALYAERRRLKEREIADLLRTAASALAYAHAQGVIHRDLKPDNILVEPTGRLVIVDFGLARRIAVRGETLTHTGAVLGTPAYMSPEQAAGTGRAVGPCTDIYSLGVVMYELLCGRRPFDGSIADVIGQHIYVAPPPPSQFRAGIDPRLEAICLKALAKKSEDRQESMADLAADLERWSSERAGIADLEDSGGRLRWGLVLLCLGGAVALFHGAWWNWVGSREGIEFVLNLACIGPMVVAAVGLLAIAGWLAFKAWRRSRAA